MKQPSSKKQKIEGISVCKEKMTWLLPSMRLYALEKMQTQP